MPQRIRRAQLSDHLRRSLVAMWHLPCRTLPCSVFDASTSRRRLAVLALAALTFTPPGNLPAAGSISRSNAVTMSGGFRSEATKLKGYKVGMKPPDTAVKSGITQSEFKKFKCAPTHTQAPWLHMSRRSSQVLRRRAQACARAMN